MKSGIGLVEWMLLLVPAVALVAALGVGGYFLWRHLYAKSARTQAPPGAGPQGQAVVLAKRTYQWPDRLGHYVTFQTGGAQPVEVEVPEQWYQYLNPGDRGALSVQGGQFGGFQKVG